MGNLAMSSTDLKHKLEAKEFLLKVIEAKIAAGGSFTSTEDMGEMKVKELLDLLIPHGIVFSVKNTVTRK